jgi:hypothetical protein
VKNPLCPYANCSGREFLQTDSTRFALGDDEGIGIAGANRSLARREERLAAREFLIKWHRAFG